MPTSRVLVFLSLPLLVPCAGAVADVETTGAEAPAEGQAEAVKPKVHFDFHGYIKMDASWDSDTIDSGNFARWVTSPSVIEEHDHFNMTARQTRLGVRVRRDEDAGLAINGRVEIDFYGGGAENKNRPQLRHAYIELDWPDRSWKVLAGQSADLISPLVPTMLNYPVAWWVGNIGYRRPQVRVTRTLGDASGFWRLAAAVSRTIGDDFAQVEPGDSGADAGVPTVQVAVGRDWTRAGRASSIGLSAHRGREELEERMGMPVLEFDSSSINLDVKLALGSRWTLLAEAWSGRNLDDYLGGIGQGIDRLNEREVEAVGGWLALESRWPRILASIGAGFDDPDAATLPPFARDRNRSIWANVIYDIRSVLQTGVELSWWETDYLDLDDGTSLRAQWSMIYRF